MYVGRTSQGSIVDRLRSLGQVGEGDLRAPSPPELMSLPSSRIEKRRDPRTCWRWKDVLGEGAWTPHLSPGIQPAVLEGRRTTEATQAELDDSRDTLMVALCTLDVLIVDDFALELMNREESWDIYLALCRTEWRD